MILKMLAGNVVDFVKKSCALNGGSLGRKQANQRCKASY